MGFRVSEVEVGALWQWIVTKELISVEVLSKSGIPIAIFQAFDKASRRL